MKYLELILGFVFGALILGACGILIWAVVADFFGWWDKPAGK